MLGIFKKKETKKEEEMVSDGFSKILEKWNLFLKKIELRFEESLINAREALIENLEDSDYDIGPTMIAWQGIKTQLMNLGEKIDKTWDNKVLPEMLKYKEEYEVNDEYMKGVKLKENVIFRDLDKFEIILEGEISQKFYNHAIKELNKKFACTQCSANLDINKNIFNPQYVSCGYCNTVNTFTSSDKISRIRWVVDNISKYESLPEWELMRSAKDEFDNIRPPHGDQDKTFYIKAYEKRKQTENSFWTKYFTSRSNFLSKYKGTIKEDVENKMKWFYDERKRELNF